MITVVLMILEEKFGKNFGDATKWTPALDFVGAVVTAASCACYYWWR